MNEKNNVFRVFVDSNVLISAMPTTSYLSAVASSLLQLIDNEIDHASALNRFSKY